MIAMYFGKGRVFEWTKPKEGRGPSDGSIVEVKAVTSAMKYVGHMPELGGSKLNRLVEFKFRFLPYIPGCTSKLSTGTDVITGPMSGCIIPLWMENNQRWVGHVGTVDASNEKANLKVKKTFGDQMKSRVKGFNPGGKNVWKVELNNIIKKIGFKGFPYICALVDRQNHCWSIAMVPIGSGRWVCAGKKEIPVIKTEDLRTKFFNLTTIEKKKEELKDSERKPRRKNLLRSLFTKTEKKQKTPKFGKPLHGMKT